MIINADSAQVYSDLPILSAQPSASEMASAPHQLFGYLDGSESCSAARWAQDARAAISAAHHAGRLPVLVGGTGLYLRTLLDGIAPIPEISAEIRADVRALPTEQAAMALAREDAALFAMLSPNDDSRIKRGLEVLRSTGQSLLHWRAEKQGGIADQIALHPVLLLPPRDWLHDRCNQRFQDMMTSGAVAEVQALLARDLPADAPVLRAIGVPEISAMLDGSISQDEAIFRAQASTRQYAKRQYTWFRNQSPPEWIRFESEFNDSKMMIFDRLLQF